MNGAENEQSIEMVDMSRSKSVLEEEENSDGMPLSVTLTFFL
jgi:hypothetical protein